MKKPTKGSVFGIVAVAATLISMFASNEKEKEQKKEERARDRAELKEEILAELKNED